MSGGISIDGDILNTLVVEWIMNIIIWVIVGIIGLIVLLLLAVQFIKIGSMLKRKIPFLYAIYLIFWILFFGLVSVGTVIGIQQKIKLEKEQSVRQERQANIEKGATQYSVEKDKANRQIQAFEIFCGNCYLSDKDKYIVLLLYQPNTSRFIKKAKQNGFNDIEIAEYYGLYIYNDVTIQDVINFGKSYNEKNDVIYKALSQSGLLDEYLANNSEQQIKKAFNLQ